MVFKMEAVQEDGRVNVNIGDEIKMTENTAMNKASEKIGNCFDSRDRRKSKYLSYPYTNIGSRNKKLPAETEDLKTPCLSHKAKASSKAKAFSKATKPINQSSSFAKSGSKRFRRNWYRKFSSCSTMSSNPEFINTSSAELLSRLFSTAVDCMFPIENKSFDLVEWFFCRYRVAKYHDEAELAASMVNAEGGNVVKSVGKDLLDIKTEKKTRKNNRTENVARRKMKSLSGLSDVSTPTGDSMGLGRKRKQKRKVDDVTPLCLLQNVDTSLNDSRSKHSSVNVAPQNLGCIASEGKAEPKRRKKIETAERKAEPKMRKKIETARVDQSAQIAATYTDAKSTKYSSVVIDLQPIYPPIFGNILEKSNGENKEELVDSNPELCVSQGLIGNITDHGILVSTTSEVGTISVNETAVKNRMEEAAEKHLNSKLAAEIPDLNGTSFEPNSMGKECENVNVLSPEVESEQPRILSACDRHTKTVNNSRMKDNGKSLGACLFLRFARGVNVPSKEDLLATFCQFGPLKASETQSLKDTGSAQVVFVRSADAGEAFRSLEQSRPFGATLVDYQLHHPPAATPPAERLQKKPFGTTLVDYQLLHPSAATPPAERLQNKPFGATLVDYQLPHPSTALPPAARLQNKQFGATLVDYRLHHPSAATPPAERFGTPTQLTNGESLGACLSLQFTPGAFVPSKEDLLATFCQFGPLKASETQSLKDTGSAQVVFVRSADAGEAFLSLEQNKSFGATLIDYKLHNPSATTPPAEQFRTPTQPAAFMPLPGGAHPPLHFIKQNLQMMTSMLESSGNNLSPQTRAKLDSEIKNLMKKVNSRTCSSPPKSKQ